MNTVDKTRHKFANSNEIHTQHNNRCCLGLLAHHPLPCVLLDLCQWALLTCMLSPPFLSVEIPRTLISPTGTRAGEGKATACLTDGRSTTPELGEEGHAAQEVLQRPTIRNAKVARVLLDVCLWGSLTCMVSPPSPSVAIPRTLTSSIGTRPGGEEATAAVHKANQGLGGGG